MSFRAARDYIARFLPSWSDVLDSIGWIDTETCDAECADATEMLGYAKGGDMCVCPSGEGSMAVVVHEMMHAALQRLGDASDDLTRCAGLDDIGHSFVVGDVMYPSMDIVAHPQASALSLYALSECDARGSWDAPRDLDPSCPPGQSRVGRWCYPRACMGSAGFFKFGRGWYSFGMCPAGLSERPCRGRGHHSREANGCICLIGAYGEGCREGYPFDEPAPVSSFDAADWTIVSLYAVNITALSGALAWGLVACSKAIWRARKRRRQAAARVSTFEDLT